MKIEIVRSSDLEASFISVQEDIVSKNKSICLGSSPPYIGGFLNLPYSTDLKVEYTLNNEENKQVVDFILNLSKAKLKEELAATRKRIVELETLLGESQ